MSVTQMKKFFFGLVVVLFFASPQSSQAESLSGSYRCWQFNVGGRGGKCSSPPILLFPDGRYKMSHETGTYSVDGDRIVFSESKYRGAGQMSEEGQRLHFEYDYKGLHHSVTYLHQGDAPQGASKPSGRGISELDLTISCAGSGSAVDWINTASLDCGDGNRYDALAVQKDKVTLSAWFKMVPPGKSCHVTVSSGFDSKMIGTVMTEGSKKQNLTGVCAW